MNPISNKHELKRDLNLVQATAINMIDMVGIGPFITMSLIVGLMQGPMSILAWILGALLAYMDGFVWSEVPRNRMPVLSQPPDQGVCLCITMCSQ